MHASVTVRGWSTVTCRVSPTSSSVIVALYPFGKVFGPASVVAGAAVSVG
jgi:hypothetical protein